MTFGFDLVELIKTIGYAGIFAIVFAESGLFFGFFFPGDSLLLTAGLLASRGLLDVIILIVGVFVSAVLGDNVGYWFGNKVGPPIFTFGISPSRNVARARMRQAASASTIKITNSGRKVAFSKGARAK